MNKSKLMCVTAWVALLAGATAWAQESAPSKDPPTKAEAAAKSAAESAIAPPRRATRADRLELDTTVVTGNRELPKVLYIVPWKKAELGDLPAQPFNTLLDEVLQPVDREEFRREVKYFHAIESGTDAAAASPAAAPSR